MMTSFKNAEKAPAGTMTRELMRDGASWRSQPSADISVECCRLPGRHRGAIDETDFLDLRVVRGGVRADVSGAKDYLAEAVAATYRAGGVCPVYAKEAGRTVDDANGKMKSTAHSRANSLGSGILDNIRRAATRDTEELSG